MTASPDDRTEEVADAVNSTERKPPARKTPVKKAPAKKTAVTRAPAKAAAEKAAATAEVVSEPVTDAGPKKSTAASARTAAAKNSASRTTGGRATGTTARSAGTTARSAGTAARSSAAKTAAAKSSTASSRSGASNAASAKTAAAKTAAAKTAAAKTAAQKAAATKTSTRTAAAKAGSAKTAAAKTAAARTAAAKAAAKAADEAAETAEDAVVPETAPAGAAPSPAAPAQEPPAAEVPLAEEPVEEAPTETPTETPVEDASASEATESAQGTEPGSTEQIPLGGGASDDTADSGEGSEPVGADPSAESAVEAIRIRGLVKSFGDHTAVNGVDLTVPAGSFYGIVGPNGAGKTTTLSIVAGLLRADAGSVTICGIDQAAKPLAAKRVMGVLPDRLRTFDRLTGRQLLFYYGLLRGLASDVIEKRVSDLARAFDLGDALSRVVSDYSAGMTKKIMLAGAMIHSPRVLVLDEPFEAVDPVSSAVILDILRAYVSHGGTVILSSHGMDLVERVCSRVAIIVGGDVLAEGTIDEVRAGQTLEARFVELSGGTGEVEGLEWLHTFSD